MSELTLCEELLNAETVSAQAFDRAAESEFCAAHLLTTAREQLAASPAEALRRAVLAEQLAERRGDWISCAQSGRLQAQALRAQGDHGGAIPAFGRAAAAADHAGNKLLAAQVQIGKVDSLGWLGRYDEALALARTLETNLQALDSPQDAAKVLFNRGSLHLRRDQFPEALQCYEQAQTLLASCGDAIALAQVQFNIATALMEMNRTDEALTLFDAARIVFAEFEMTTLLGMTDANRGFLLALSGRPAAAIAALTRARDEFMARGQSLEAAKCDADMADSYYELNLYPEALECYDRAVSELEALGIDYERARAETGRATVLMRIQRNADALEALERATKLFHSHRNRARLAHVGLLKSCLLQQEGKTEEAQTEIRRAAATLRRKGRHGWAAEARFLALDWQAAAAQAQNAESIPSISPVRALTGIRRTARKWARGWLECQVEQALGRHFLRQNNINRALKHFRAGVAVLEQVRTEIAPETLHVAYLRDKLSVYEDIVAVLLERGRPRDIAEALEYVERAKSRLLLERMQQTLEQRTTDAAFSAPARQEIARLRSELNRIYHQLHGLDEGEARRFAAADAESAAHLSTVEEAYRRALHEAEISGSPSASRTLILPDVPTASELQHALASDEALIEFTIVHGQVCAFVVTAQNVRFVRLAPLVAVRHSIRRLRYQLERAAWTNAYTHRHSARFLAAIQEVLGELYDLLWRPLCMDLSAEKVVVIPQGELHGLPFHALFDGTDYALDHWEIVYSPSAAFWNANQQRSKNAPASEALFSLRHTTLLIGVPEAGIERVAAEVEMLHDLLPKTQLLCRDKATIEAVSRLAAECHVFHIATHALYRADNPLFSGLKLADGWLLARDLYEMKLTCGLATLSACQTGAAFVDAGDELFGLVRGFLSAGARSVAASLWVADDSATAALMEPFYTQMMQTGASPASALRAAQQALRKQQPHPYYWAAFALFGERGASGKSID